MAVFSGTLRSSTLGMDTGLHVILPYDRPAPEQQHPAKVLYLLHGMGENSSAWCRYTSIERHARKLGLAVVMPEVQRSFYMNMRHGMQYFSYITEELPRLCAELFHISDRKEDMYIGGLSMGGYGALRCALTAPYRYTAAASLSGFVDIRTLLESSYKDQDTHQELIATFGEGYEIGMETDLLALAEEAAKAPDAPRIFAACGEQDYLFEMNNQVSEHFSRLLPGFVYQTSPGAHDWEFWDRFVSPMLQFFTGNT